MGGFWGPSYIFLTFYQPMLFTWNNEKYYEVYYTWWSSATLFYDFSVTNSKKAIKSKTKPFDTLLCLVNKTPLFSELPWFSKRDKRPKKWWGATLFLSLFYIWILFFLYIERHQGSSNTSFLFAKGQLPLCTVASRGLLGKFNWRTFAR